MKKNKLVDTAKDVVLASISMGVVNSSPLPSSFKSGTNALIGVKLIDKTFKRL